MKDGLVGFHKRNYCKLMFMGVSVRADFKKAAGAWELLEIWSDWQVLLKRYNQVAPPTVGKAIIVSDLFVSMATQVEAIMSTALTIWVACVLVVVVVVLCTGSLQMACLILVNLLAIVCFVVAMMSQLEMEFGGVEAIALTVLIGMSCDYCLHLSDTILTGRSKSRSVRVRAAITHLGPTIVSAAENFSPRVRAHRGFLRHPHPEQFRAHHVPVHLLGRALRHPLLLPHVHPLRAQIRRTLVVRDDDALLRRKPLPLHQHGRFLRVPLRLLGARTPRLDAGQPRRHLRRRLRERLRTRLRRHTRPAGERLQGEVDSPAVLSDARRKHVDGDTHPSTGERTRESP